MKKYVFFFCFIFIVNFAYAQTVSRLLTTVTLTNEFIAVIDHNLHVKYGCMYPMTYQMDIPHVSSGLQVYRKYTSSDSWALIQEKTVRNFNGIEAVRFDYSNYKAYISTPFSSTGDSLFIRIDSQSIPIAPLYRGLSKYYDNRVAAVTCTADDWCNSNVIESDHRFGTLLNIFRSYNLYVTVGIITSSDSCNQQTWDILQNQLNLGYVEAASHSRTHPYSVPYSNLNGEVLGSYDTIIAKLTLPTLFHSEGRQYVYIWIAPGGFFDDLIKAKLSSRSYLIPRLYSPGDRYATSYAEWDDAFGHFADMDPTVEIGNTGFSGWDTSLASLNYRFDTVVTNNGIYHLMWHPQYLFADRGASYFLNHLNHISNRDSIWYVSLGHLYLYRLLQEIHTTFTDGSNFTPNITRGDTDQELGRFKLVADGSGASLSNVSILLNGTRTGLSNFKFYSALDETMYQSHLLSTVTSDPGNGHSVSFSNISSPLASPDDNWFFITANVASGATGSIQCIITQNSSLTLHAGLLSGTITNASLSNGNSPLPVELSTFTASVVENRATLQWKTSSENNNYGFEVERRTISHQQIAQSSIGTWQKIGFIQGSGTSNAPKEYSFTDTKLTTGTYMYRLKQIDNNGAYKYSGEVEVTLSVPKVFALNQNYPNPFNPTTTIEFTLAEDGMTTLKVYDMLGKEVTTLVDEDLEAGVLHQATFNASRLSSGMYFYRLENGNQTQVRKLMLMK